MSGLIVRSWADQEDLQAALRRGIPSLILEAVNSSAFQQKISFMANPDFGARLADAHLVIAPKTHCYGAGWFGPASIMCAGGFSRARGSEVFHATKIICWETARASRGLTVGCFPHLRFVPEHRPVTGGSWISRYDLVSAESACAPRYNEVKGAAFPQTGRGRSAESSAKIWSHCSAMARASVRTSSACLMSF